MASKWLPFLGSFSCLHPPRWQYAGRSSTKTVCLMLWISMAQQSSGAQRTTCDTNHKAQYGHEALHARVLDRHLLCSISHQRCAFQMSRHVSIPSAPTSWNYPALACHCESPPSHHPHPACHSHRRRMHYASCTTPCVAYLVDPLVALTSFGVPHQPSTAHHSTAPRRHSTSPAWWRVHWWCAPAAIHPCHHLCCPLSHPAMRCVAPSSSSTQSQDSSTMLTILMSPHPAPSSCHPT